MNFEQVAKLVKPTANLLREHPAVEPQKWIKTARSEMDTGDIHYAKQEWDQAYLNYMFAVQLVLDVIPNHRKFTATDLSYQQIRSKLTQIMARLESIKITLKSVTSPNGYLPPGGGGIRSPTSTNLGNPPSISNNGTATVNYNGSSSSNSKNVMNNSSSTPTHGREASSTTIGYASSSTPPASKVRSEGTRTTSATPPPAYSTQEQHQQQHNAGLISVAARLQNLQQTVQASQSSSPALGIPSSPSVSSSSSSQLNSISPVELQQILSANSSSSAKPNRILFFDIRPMEEYVGGHLGWRSNVLTIPDCGGIIHIEPEWLVSSSASNGASPYLGVKDLSGYLEGFGSSNQNSKILFDKRFQVDMIVFYDKDSRGPKIPNQMQTLYDTLYSNNSKEQTLPSPKVLGGGFTAWNYYIGSVIKKFDDWIEIGEGHGVMPPADLSTYHPSPEFKTNNISNTSSVNSSPIPFNQGNNTNMGPAVYPSLKSTSVNGGGYIYGTSQQSGIYQQQPLQQNNYVNSAFPQKQFQQIPRTLGGAESNYSGSALGSNGTNSPNLSIASGNTNRMISGQQQTIYTQGTSMSTVMDAYGSRPSKQLPDSSQIMPHSRQGSFHGSQAIPASRTGSIRKDTFNDPFLGSTGGADYSTNYERPGLRNPLISLPNNGNNSGEFGIYTQAERVSVEKILYQEPAQVAYPRAYSPSPPKTVLDESSFAERYPTAESFTMNASKPAAAPPPIPMKPRTTSVGAQPGLMNPPPMSSQYRPQYMQPSIGFNSPHKGGGLTPPVIPPKPPGTINSTSIPPISYKPIDILASNVQQLNLNYSNSQQQLNGPPTAPKPRISQTQFAQASPSLPPKLGALNISTIARGTHSFLIPTSPSGNKFGISGLRNLGNTCFMNSILQCLSATFPFARYFMDGSYKKHISRTNPLSSKGKVTEAFSSLVRNLWSTEESVVVPTDFKCVIGDLHSAFAGNEQQDSQEFLSFLLDQLHEDLNVARRPFPPNGPDLDSENYNPKEFMMMEWQKYKTRNWSIIVDMFQGILQSVLQCLTCGKTSTTYNMFMYLTLPIPSVNSQGTRNGPVTIFECLKSFLAPEKLSGDDQWKCPRCKMNRDAAKTLSIVKLPTVLLIHFKRFSFQGPFRDKLETPIDYPVKRLDLTEYAKIDEPEGKTFNLIGVSNHFGGLQGGHYTANVKDFHTNKWYNLDDSRVSEANESDIRTSAAYILFYLCDQPQMGNWWNGNTPQ